MNEEMVRRWNDRVGKGDIVYHLGDISFGTKPKTIEIMKRLKGQIHVIRGNHDNEATLKIMVSEGIIVGYWPYKEIVTSNYQRLVLFHFPIVSWHRMHQGSWHLHGHCHGNLTFDNGPMMDVGVDCTDFAPISYDEVAKRLDGIPYAKRDHHDSF